MNREDLDDFVETELAADMEESRGSKKGASMSSVALPKQSDLAFKDALFVLMDRDELSFRQLAQKTKGIDGKGVTHSFLNMVVNGHDKPSERAMTLIAQVFHITPDYFVEYRFAEGRKLLDPEVVGFDKALENLNRLWGEQRRRSGAGRAGSRKKKPPPGSGSGSRPRPPR